MLESLGSVIGGMCNTGPQHRRGRGHEGDNPGEYLHIDAPNEAMSDRVPC
jgi:hypothetical protein